MPLGIRGANPVWNEFDLQGQLFDDTFWLFVLENTIPYQPAIVWHDPDLNTEWTNPIQFLGNGTLPIDIYFESGKVYRLEFRQHIGLGMPTQADPLIYEVNNYIAGEGGSTPVDTVAFASSNQITNPQFSLINFTSPYSFTGTDPDPIEVAPGWTLELAGTGLVTITQIPLNNANINPSNAPYALRIVANGWNDGSVILRQRFEQNGMLWANKFVSSAITARIEGAPQSISATLVDSNNVLLATVLNGININSDWNEYTDYGDLPDTTNPDTPPAAFIDYRLNLPSNMDISVTSFQLVVQDLPIKPSFEQDSINRQIDHTFNYYNDPLQYKPIPSLLTGWDFALNPAQLGSPAITTTPGYIWDQTICASAVNTINVSRVTTNGAFSATTTVGTDAFYMLQYLQGAQAFETTLSNLAVNISAYLLNNPNVVCRISMYYSNAAGTIPVLPTTIGTIASTGIFTLTAANWAIIPQQAAFSNQFTLSSTAPFADFKSLGWNGGAFSGSSAVANFAIVVSFAIPTSGTTVVVNSISCVAGDIATRPAPQTPDEVLRECQYYYEKSYATADLPGTSTSVNQCLVPMIIGLTFSPQTMGVVANSFQIPFLSSKRVTPNMQIYTPTGTPATVTVSGFANGVLIGADFALTGNWQNLQTGTKRANYVGNFNGYLISTGPGNVSAAALYHFTADARLGII